MFTVATSKIPILTKTSYPTMDVYQYSESPVYTVSTPLTQQLMIKVEEAPFQLVYPLPSYLDMNQNPEVRKKLAKYYYYKTLDKWLLKEDGMLDILNYLQVKGDTVHLINSISDYKETNVNKDTQDVIDKKIKYIENNIFEPYDMEKILNSYVQETGTNWYDLEKHAFYVKQAVRGFLKKKLKNMINK